MHAGQFCDSAASSIELELLLSGHRVLERDLKRILILRLQSMTQFLQIKVPSFMPHLSCTDTSVTAFCKIGLFYRALNSYPWEHVKLADSGKLTVKNNLFFRKNYFGTLKKGC